MSMMKNMIGIGTNRPRRSCLWTVILCGALLFCALPIISSPAQACSPGIPCDVDFTPNDPFNMPISPNASGPNAAKSESGTCDADFMNQIYARAYLEAERENVMSKLIVLKPDSVLEYSCFEQTNSRLADYGGPLFSENDRWWDLEVTIDGKLGFDYIASVPMYTHLCEGDMPCDKLDKSLEALVLTALMEYAGKNFAHDYLGGTANGLNNDFTGSIGDSYLCDHIFAVHQMAKCKDFATYDSFMTFEEIMNFSPDPRTYPTPCSGTQITQERIDIAKNKDFAYAAFDQVSETYREKMEIGKCDDNPIPTGVMTIIRKTEYDLLRNPRNTTETYEEHICPNPGCSYNLTTKKCQ